MPYIKVNEDKFNEYYLNLTQVLGMLVETTVNFQRVSDGLELEIQDEELILSETHQICERLKEHIRYIRRQSNFIQNAGSLYKGLTVSADVQTVSVPGRLEATSEPVTISTQKIDGKVANNKSQEEIYNKEFTAADLFKSGFLGSIYDLFQFKKDGVGLYYKIKDEEMPNSPIGSGILTLLDFPELIVDVINNAIDREGELHEINTNSSLSEEQKEYRRNVVETLSDINAGTDAASWALDALGVPIIPEIVDGVGDALNSAAMKEQLYENDKEIQKAKERCAKADNPVDKMVAGFGVACEYVEAAVDTLTTFTVEVVEEVFVEPVKTLIEKAGNGLKKFCGLFRRR